MDTAAQVILIKHIAFSQFIIKTYNQFKTHNINFGSEAAVMRRKLQNI